MFVQQVVSTYSGAPMCLTKSFALGITCSCLLEIDSNTVAPVGDIDHRICTGAAVSESGKHII